MALEILVWVLECFGQQPNLLLDFLIFGTPESVGQQRVAFRLVPPGEATSQFCSETTPAKPPPPLHQPLQMFSTPEMLHLWSEAASDQRSCCLGECIAQSAMHLMVYIDCCLGFAFAICFQTT